MADTTTPSPYEIWALADWELTKLKTELEHERDRNGRRLSPDLQAQIRESLQAVVDEMADRKAERSKPLVPPAWMRNRHDATALTPHKLRARRSFLPAGGGPRTAAHAHPPYARAELLRQERDAA